MELKGQVNKLFESLITIEILSDIGFAQTEFIIGTGFNGDLVLPKSAIIQLGLPYLFSAEIELVGETTKEVDFFKGQIRWLNDEIITVDIIADDSNLVGTNLLRLGKLWIDFQSKKVLITNKKYEILY